MPAWRREAESVVAAELGGSGVTWVDWPVLVTGSAAMPAPVVVSAVGHRVPSEERVRAFEGLARAVEPGAVVVVVDHNRPRRLPAALAALVGAPFVSAWWPPARWRRLAQPTARELQAAGFRVERLRLAVGERLQIVVARREDE